MLREGPNIIAFQKDDPEDAKNWPMWKKRLVVAQVCFLSFAAVFGSSLYAAVMLQLQAKYDASETIISLGLSGYVLGFSLGPILCPMSEMYGRRLPYLISWPLLVGFCAPSAYVNNLAVILSFRFLAGCCAACALNNGGGILTDMFMNDIQAQGKAIGLYAASVFAGPCVALPIGFLIVANTGPELWVLRVYFFFVAAVLPVALFLPESHGLTILAARARRYRGLGIRNARAAHELDEETAFHFFQVHLGRPLSMFMKEPIIQAAAVWTSLAYGITYLFFEIYPVVFYQNYNFSLQLAGLPFLAMIIGFMTAIVVNKKLVQVFVHMPFPSFLLPDEAHSGSPEARMKLSMLACFLMPASLLWFAWTSGGHMHWIVPTLAGIPFGFAAITIFFIFLTYTAETYTILTTSANTVNTFCRSLIASVFPLVASPLMKHLGIKWGVSLFAFLSLGLIPIPLILLRYGASIRKKSRYAREAEGLVSRMQSGVLLTTSSRLRERREIHVSLSTTTLQPETAESSVTEFHTSYPPPPGIYKKPGRTNLALPPSFAHNDSTFSLASEYSLQPLPR